MSVKITTFENYPCGKQKAYASLIFKPRKMDKVELRYRFLRLTFIAARNGGTVRFAINRPRVCGVVWTDQAVMSGGRG